MSRSAQPRDGIPADKRLRAASIAVAAFLEPRADKVVEDLLELLRAQLPAYSEETMDALRQRIRIVLGIVLERLSQGQVPDARDAEELATLARGWASAGLPLDQRSFQIGARRVVSLVAGHAVELDLDPATMFAMQDRIWEWATMCASILADAHRDHAVAVARRDAAGRADFLRDLAAGRATMERLARARDEYDLDLDRPYFAVTAECDDAGTAAAVGGHVRRSGSTEDCRALEVVLDRRLLAITPQVPAEYPEVAIAIGPAAALADMHPAFAEAFEALATARSFGITGIVELGSLGPLPLVTEAQTLAARLSDRHLRPLDASGASGTAIEHTVRTLLDHDRNVEATAAELHLHRNSIRYRMGRFHQLTGLDLHRTEDLVTAWWLLKRRQATRAAEDAPRA